MRAEDKAPDLILVTIGAWRLDALAHMPFLSGMGSPWFRAHAICQAPRRGAGVRTLLTGLSPSDSRPSRVQRPTLPAMLAANGYWTCAVLGEGPGLEKWGVEFADFRCASAVGPGAREGGVADVWRRFWLLPLVRAANVCRLALERYEGMDRPRFLWLHLTDTAEPLEPGFREVGVGGFLRSRAALTACRRAASSRGPVARRHRVRVADLYARCAGQLDSALRELVDGVRDDAAVLIVGEQGMSMGHAPLQHARLYDECVRVPLVGRLPGGVALLPSRQATIAPALVKALGLSAPAAWTDSGSADGDVVPLHCRGGADSESYLGLRTTRWKYICTYRGGTSVLSGEELYDLESDPEEAYNIAGDLQFEPTRAGLARLLRREFGRSDERSAHAG